MASRPSRTFAPGRLAGVGGVGEKSSTLMYLETEPRLMPSRRAISRPETPWESSLEDMFYNGSLGIALFFLVPSLMHSTCEQGWEASRRNLSNGGRPMTLAFRS